MEKKEIYLLNWIRTDNITYWYEETLGVFLDPIEAIIAEEKVKEKISYYDNPENIKIETVKDGDYTMP